MSKIVKGIAKAVKGIFKGVKKVFKAITKSTLGKVLLIAATIYLGGAALGYWQSPFASINGALTSGGAAAAEGSAAAATLEGGGAAAQTFGLGEAAAPVGEALASSAPAASAVPSSAAVPALSTTAAPAGASVMTMPSGMTVNLSAAGTEAARQGIIGKAMAAFQGLPDLTQYGLINAASGAVQGAFTPSATEQAEEQARIQREQEEWRQRFLAPNFDVGSIDVGSPSGRPLTDQSGAPVHHNNGQMVPPGFTRDANGNLIPMAAQPRRGIINTAMRR